MRSNKEIVDLIKQLMQQKGLTLSELARRTGVAKSTLSRYLNGSREFPLKLAETFAEPLDTTSEFLLGISAKSKMENESADLVAAHIDDDTPPEEREQIINFIENLKKARSDEKK